MTKEILDMLKKQDLTQKQLAQRLNISEPTLSKKMTLDNWREKDLYRIAEVCDCKYEGKFIL